MINMLSLNFKNALITGCSSGIGKSTAELFSKLGANILITGRNLENLTDTANLCKSNKVNENQKVITFIADLTKEEDVKKLAEKTLTEFPKLDILVNNAGIISNDNIENIVVENFDHMMNINLRSVIQLTNLLSQSLIDSKGSIINVSSVAGTRAFPNVMSYCISKAALEQFTKCAALDLASKGVRVNAVSPGVTVTNLHTRGGMTKEAYEAFLEKSKTTHAMGRAGDPIEVAYSIAFLASSASSFTTGGIFPIDGGRHLMCPR